MNVCVFNYFKIINYFQNHQMSERIKLTFFIEIFKQNTLYGKKVGIILKQKNTCLHSRSISLRHYVLFYTTKYFVTAGI